MVPTEEAWPQVMSTATVAAASGYSVQQVRDLEALGVIPAATRAPNGYRQFAAEHVRGLRAYRDLARAVGAVEARRVMRQIYNEPPDVAAALICEFHTGLNREREQTLAARSALQSISAETMTDDAPTDADAMTITELSRAIGVKASTLRFWESAGLVTPDRISTRSGTARRYPVAAIREARITAALRAGGYRAPDVRKAIDAVRKLTDVAGSLAALDARLEAIAERAFALFRASAVLAESVELQRYSVTPSWVPRDRKLLVSGSHLPQIERTFR
ncbi:MerR family transcriptional regulator [Gordonia aichiensis]|uniref:MerR family transcriptional regulator n=1 Tax=Gordonia aichiensis TaxID=36820 RepID=UPI001FDF08B5|nr:MerR family transcriptional regulator [Gordonia aichiensis]